MVAAVVASPAGALLIYGTVLPWGTDPEWGRLRDAHPGVPLIVAGDLNMNLGGPPYDGTNRCRAEMLAGVQALGLACATAADRIPAGALGHAPIDHVLVPASWSTRVVSAWEGTLPDVHRLSDHSGVVVEVGGGR